MRTLNTSNYALLYEQKTLGYFTAINEADASGTPAPAAEQNSISILPDDLPEVQAIKKLVIDNAGKGEKADAEFKKINDAATRLAATKSAGQEVVKVKIGDKEYSVVVACVGVTTAGGRQQVYVDYDATSVLIEGLNMNYLATQFRRGVEGSSVFGLDFGTDEDKLGAVAGAIYRLAFSKNADPLPIFEGLKTAYQNQYGESLTDAVMADFSGYPEVLARALYGETITEDDLTTAGWVNFGESLIADVAIGLATFGVGAAARGVFTGVRAVRAAGAINKLRGGATAFRSGFGAGVQQVMGKGGATIARQATGVGVPGAANVSTLAAGATVDKAMAQSGFSAITQAGAASAKGAAIGAGVGAGIAGVQGASALANGAEQDLGMGTSFSPEDAAYAFCSQIRDLAKGYTDAASELQIGFMIMSLTPQTATIVEQVWSANYGDDGDFYTYCVKEELDDDMLSLINGYWAGITGKGDLATQVNTISANMQKPTLPGAAAPIKESLDSLKSFKDFLRS
jgi:hypothetical protein